jgi:type I restriction enzyme S subunit
VGAIPEDWDARPLGEDITLLSGHHILAQHCNTRGEGIPYLTGPADFPEGIIAHTKFTDKPSTKCEPGDILVTVKGSGAGTLVTTDAVYCISRQLMAIRVRDWDKRFIYYSLLHNASQFNAASTGLIPGLSRVDILEQLLPVPPLPEQRAIAAALSDVDALLEGLTRLIAKKRDLKQAAMQQLLTGQTRLPGFHGEWEVKRLGDVAEIVMGQSPRSSSYNKQGDGLPLIQGNADVANRQTIVRVFTSQITKRGRTGDVLLSVRAPVGEVSRATFDVCLGRGVCALRFPNDFLYHYLIYLEPAWAKHSKGSTFDSVNSNDVKGVEITLPAEAEEQTAIATVLSDMDAELSALEARRDKTRSLKQAMMQELLTGRTRLVAPAQATEAAC